MRTTRDDSPHRACVLSFAQFARSRAMRSFICSPIQTRSGMLLPASAEAQSAGFVNANAVPAKNMLRKKCRQTGRRLNTENVVPDDKVERRHRRRAAEEEAVHGEAHFTDETSTCGNKLSTGYRTMVLNGNPHLIQYLQGLQARKNTVFSANAARRVHRSTKLLQNIFKIVDNKQPR